MSCNITQQLIKTSWHTLIVLMRTKDKILQHNRPDANSFFLSKQTENCRNIFEDTIKIVEMQGF